MIEKSTDQLMWELKQLGLQKNQIEQQMAVIAKEIDNRAEEYAKNQNNEKGTEKQGA